MSAFRTIARWACDEWRRTLFVVEPDAHGDFPYFFAPAGTVQKRAATLRRAVRWAVLLGGSLVCTATGLIFLCSVVFAASAPVIIGHSDADHHGGQVTVFVRKYAEIRVSGRNVIIDGPCVSACTIVASLPRSQVCVTPRAEFGVHLAADENDQSDRAYTDWAVKTFYPPALQTWIARHGGLGRAPKWIRYRDLLAIFSPCPRTSGDTRQMTDNGRRGAQ